MTSIYDVLLGGTLLFLLAQLNVLASFFILRFINEAREKIKEDEVIEIESQQDIFRYLHTQGE
tara:strand:+ start:1105 stop:1293 length:189 start_codon:yes stop_codon:yes gene_type:complete